MVSGCCRQPLAGDPDYPYKSALGGTTLIYKEMPATSWPEEGRCSTSARVPRWRAERLQYGLKGAGGNVAPPPPIKEPQPSVPPGTHVSKPPVAKTLPLMSVAAALSQAPPSGSSAAMTSRYGLLIDRRPSYRRQAGKSRAAPPQADLGLPVLMAGHPQGASLHNKSSQV